MATFLQSKSGNTSAAGATVTATFGSACKLNNTLLAFGYWTTDPITASVSDPTNGTWRTVSNQFVGTGGNAGIAIQMFYVYNSQASTAITVTLTLASGSAARGIAVAEYAGLYVPVGPMSGNNVLASATATSNSYAALSGQDLGFAGCITATVSSANAPWNLRESANFGSNGMADLVTTTASAGAAITWNVGSVSDNTLGICMFTPAGMRRNMSRYPGRMPLGV
jgi:hypothetical protein